MRSAVGSSDAIAATEYSQQSRSRWQTLGVATATEHSEFTVAAGQDATLVSIGSIKVFRAARHDPATVTQELVRRGIQERLNVTVFCHDISNHRNRAATKHTNSRPHPHICTSWSGNIEAISESVAAYQKASYATEHNACVYVKEVLKIHVQTLLNNGLMRSFCSQKTMMSPS